MASSTRDGCAPGVQDWSVKLNFLEPRVTAEIAAVSHEQAARIADELAALLRGPRATD